MRRRGEIGEGANFGFVGKHLSTLPIGPWKLVRNLERFSHKQNKAKKAGYILVNIFPTRFNTKMRPKTIVTVSNEVAIQIFNFVSTRNSIQTEFCKWKWKRDFRRGSLWR